MLGWQHVFIIAKIVPVIDHTKLSFMISMNVASLIYSALTVALFIQAILGRPIITY